MKQDLKNAITGIFVLIFYLLSNFNSSLILNILKINYNNLSTFNKIIYNISFELILIIIIIFIYRKTIINDLKNLKNIHFSNYIRYWFISLGLMLISNIIITMITNINTSSNQDIIVDTFSKAPIYTIILTVLFAPILEELVFRLSFRKMFKTDIIFIITSGLFFGFMHIINSNSLLELLYIIPYSIPGIIFAYTLKKSDNIFVPIGLHFMHNTLMILLQIILLFIK